MKRKIISIIVLVLIIAVLVGGTLLVYFRFRPATPKSNGIALDHEYHLTEIHPNSFEGLTLDADSYIKINADKKTGELYLVGVSNEKIPFIVTNYQKNTLNIEFIYKNQLHKLQGEGTEDQITFKTVQRYRADVTQENPDDTKYLEYISTILVFRKEVN